MVLIDMPMPDRCLDCPFFKKHSDCGQCKGTKKGKWIEPEDYNERQVWCPLKEGEQMPSAQPDWDEMIVICDCCGHTIHVQRQYAERKGGDGNG